MELFENAMGEGLLPFQFAMKNNVGRYKCAEVHLNMDILSLTYRCEVMHANHNNRRTNYF